MEALKKCSSAGLILLIVGFLPALISPLAVLILLIPYLLVCIVFSTMQGNWLFYRFNVFSGIMQGLCLFTVSAVGAIFESLVTGEDGKVALYIAVSSFVISAAIAVIPLKVRSIYIWVCMPQAPNV